MHPQSARHYRIPGFCIPVISDCEPALCAAKTGDNVQHLPVPGGAPPRAWSDESRTKGSAAGVLRHFERAWSACPGRTRRTPWCGNWRHDICAPTRAQTRQSKCCNETSSRDKRHRARRGSRTNRTEWAANYREAVARHFRRWLSPPRRRQCLRPCPWKWPGPLALRIPADAQGWLLSSEKREKKKRVSPKPQAELQKRMALPVLQALESTLPAQTPFLVANKQKR